jgi:hypothetical protein
LDADFMEPMLFSNMDSDKREGFSHDRVDTGKDEWLTPPSIIEALGPFDLDPCSPISRPWPTAARHLTVYDDGLKTPWGGVDVRVWLNPPYGNFTPLWMKKIAEHGNGCALIYCRTETKSFFPWVWKYATAIFFFSHRIRFFHVNGKEGDTAGAPSCIVAYGDANANKLLFCTHKQTLKGAFIDLRGGTIAVNN